MSSAMRAARIAKEMMMITSEPPAGISCWEVEDSNSSLEARIIGVAGSPYQNGVFKLFITMPERYPFEPPQIKFSTKIYHPNIDGGGRICLDLLKMPPAGNWKPSLNILTVLTSIQLLMTEPNPDDGLMSDIAKEYQRDKPTFMKKATEWTLRYATEAAAVPTTQSVVAAATSESESDNDEE